NKSTGMVTNASLLSGNPVYGVCFSENNSKLYVNEGGPFGHIYQYDLSAGNNIGINNSKMPVLPALRFTHLQRGPDGKIYFLGEYIYPNGALNPNGALTLSVIHNP